MNSGLELAACKPLLVHHSGFNSKAEIPYGCTTDHIRMAMNGFIDFLGFINQQLHTKQIERLEVMLMPANFSSIVGEFMSSNIPKYCSSIIKNKVS